MKYTIEDLKNGKCAVLNDSTVEELNKVLRLAFPKLATVRGSYKFYYKHSIYKTWGCSDVENLPYQSVKDFLSFTPKRGDLVEVKYEGDEWVKRIYLGVIEGAYCPYITVNGLDEDNYRNGNLFGIMNFSHMREIKKEEIVELTMEDISNGKGTGIPSHLIRIKK